MPIVACLPGGLFIGGVAMAGCMNACAPRLIRRRSRTSAIVRKSADRCTPAACRAVKVGARGAVCRPRGYRDGDAHEHGRERP
ncbi:hypothetical protein HYPSUDRAFT_66803 [Hypholoma sublateritium FD-334 SS-4]|uniref:Uncharacterized protein n=1 Tax=Hypholoma sublateritium (strain FD-334 SS-4) TaxID=945553 RepID=A0A0D2MGS0_HYPSF|nr:hypothetical protein HYPSUDRAFT_66803 [Hypholoma sublateritium FD-334 SS-4]